MKRLLSLIFGALFLALTVRAQSGPEHSQFITSGTPIPDNDFQALIQPEFTPAAQPAAAIAEAITPDIQALAGNLGGDPTRIFNYVHDQIRYVHYFGSKKGAELTLLERSGNDFDQCALLVALLQTAGYTNVGYQFGLMNMPYDSPNHQDLHHWLGLSLLNTNWGNTQNYFNIFLPTRGFQIYKYPGDTNHVAFHRVWVVLTLGGTNYYLDPSFKVSEPVPNIDLTAAMGLNTSNLLATAGGTEIGGSVTGLNEPALRGALQTGTSNLLSYLSNNAANATVAQIIGGRQIVSSSGQPWSTSLAFPLYTNSAYPPLSWTWQPTNFMSSFSVTLGAANQTWWTPQLQGQRVSLTFNSSGLAQLWLEDSLVWQINNTGGGAKVNVTLTATHPYGGWNISNNLPVDAGGFDQSNVKGYQTTNASYALLYAFDASPAWLQARQQKLDAYRQGLPDSSRQVVTETLNVMGLNWMVQTELGQEMLAQEGGQLSEFQHRFGRMAQEAGNGYYVDVFLDLSGIFPGTGWNAPDIHNLGQAFDIGTYLMSALEHGLIEQLQNSNLTAASTVKMLEIASINGQAVWLASSTNWSSVSSNLEGYGASVLNTLNNQYIPQGYTVLLPQNGTNAVAGPGTWAGDGYAALWQTASGSRDMEMRIDNQYNGGFVSNPQATVSPPVVSSFADIQQNFYNPQSATLPLAGPTGADPVNLVDGSFEVTAADLSLGLKEPRGFNLTRYYSSDRRAANPAGLGFGWLHNYYAAAVPVSAPQLVLGQGTAPQAAPLIVATWAALNLYTSSNADARNWLTTALIAKWGVDQLINNSVSVNLGRDTLQFTRQPNGQYTPPANCTMTLFPTNGAFWLQERHGRTFKFGGGTLLTNIVDQYGQTMKFTYNTNNLVSTITDWTNRSLTFKYSAGLLTNVADSTGRSVSYGYTSNNLTAFTDAEGKTNGYAYDTNHDVLATYDALGNLVVTNLYDGFGHVKTQLTQGLPNKTWQIYSSGYYTVEIDPAGGQKVMTYDRQSRLIAQQDALGNVTQIAYDGQDHVIQTVSPLGETNQCFYDDNNNLIETVDPLGHASQFIYDANNNLVATIDADSHPPATYGYNAQFSLTGQTNSAGDWVNYVYNANGTLSAKTDAGGMTTCGYDTNGQLNSLTYPNGLGSEGFFKSPLGDVLIHTNGRGFTNAFSYNARRELTNSAASNVVARIVYDAVGNVLGTTDPRGNTTAHTWSATRHLLTTTLPATPQGAPVITNGYDGRDWLTRTADPLNNSTLYASDPAGRLLAQAAPVNLTNTFACDADGRTLVTTNAAGETTGQTWDARGSLIRLTDGAGHFSVRAYDPAGNQITLTNRNTNTWQFTFDAANRLVSTMTPAGHVSGVTYNHQGLVVSSTNLAGQVTTCFYDAKGRLTNRVDTLDAIAYGHDADDNLTGVTEGSQSARWTYDAYDRVYSYQDVNGYTTQYRYDANGNVTNLIYPGSRNVYYAYDTLNRLTNVTDWTGRETSLTYDLASHLTTLTRPNGTHRTISYDAAGEVTNIWEQMANNLPIAWFRLNWANSGNLAWEFAAPLPHTTNPPPTRTMTCDVDNRLASVNGTNVINDLDGNLTYGPLPIGSSTIAYFTNYACDVRDRLSTAAGVVNSYDALNNRIGQNYGTNTTTYVVNPNTALPQVLMRVKNGVTTYYIYGAGLLYQITETATATNTLTYHYDYRGSTVALSADNGLVTNRIEYALYGLTTYRSGTTDTPFLFNGRYGIQTDPNGLLFMRSRYYNPYLCRFVNPDPSGFKGGLNFYAYANGNPVSYLDPFGLGAESGSSANDDSGGIRFSGSIGEYSTPGPSLTTAGVVTTVAVIAFSLISDSEAALPEELEAAGITDAAATAGDTVAAEGTTALSPYRMTTAGETFSHYGYADSAASFEGGLRPGGFATSSGDLSGAEAQSGLALRHATPPNAVYTVTPQPGTWVRVNPVTAPQFGQPGGFPEFQFPGGTGPGTVSPPRLIP